MSDLNRTSLIGRLGADPDVRYMPNSDAVANVSLATGESWKDRETGEKRERTEWHRVVFFGKLAEIVKEYLHKGSRIYVEGKLRTRKWQGQDGQDRYTTEIVVSGYQGAMQMLDGRRPKPEQQSPEESPPPSVEAPGAPDPQDDDISS